MRILILLAVAGAAWGQAAPDPAFSDPPFYDRTIASYTTERIPNWIKISGEFRFREEGRTGFGYQPGNDDAYSLLRTRLNLELLPSPWVGLFFQGQDARVEGINPGRPLTIFKDPHDVRQAYVRLGKAGGKVKLIVGRQLLNYGAQRLLGPLDWTNTSRSWDAARLQLGTPGARLDLFASTVVVIDPNRSIDQPRRGFNIHGAYGSFRHIVPKTTFEPYVLWKTGHASIWTGGVRFAAAPGTPGLDDFDYQLELVRQWGSVGSLSHSAWAGTGTIGHRLPGLGWSAHVSAEYSYASGDRNPGDHQHHTFDQLLGTNHLFYGLVDAVGWQNLRNIRIGADAHPRQTLQLGADYHWLWLDSPRDALYDVAGHATIVPRAGNTARSIGTELDFTAAWAASAVWKWGGGVGHLFAGDFLKQNSAGSSQTFPYIFAQYSF